MDLAQVALTTRAHYDEDARFDPQLLQPVLDVMVRYGKAASPIAASNLGLAGVPLVRVQGNGSEEEIDARGGVAYDRTGPGTPGRPVSCGVSGRR